MSFYNRGVEYDQGAIGDTFLSSLDAKVKKTLEMNRVQLDDFDGFYPDNKLAADAEYVEIRNKGHASYGSEFSTAEIQRMEKAKKMSDLLEAIMVDPKVVRAWYSHKNENGDTVLEVNSMGTSELDDYANGVDMVWELNQQSEGVTHLGLAVDVTFSSSFEEKLQYIKGDIETGQMGKVEYFMPRWGDMQGKVMQIPRVVVGIDAYRLSELAVLWARIDERMDDLKNDPTQQIILKEILVQLPVYAEYAKSIGQEDLANKILITNNRFEKLYRWSTSNVKIPEDLIMEDKVFTQLQEYLDNFRDVKAKVSSGKLRADISRKHGVK